MLALATIAVCASSGVAMATLATTPSSTAAINQHQTRGHACSAFRASTPAAVNQLQDWSSLLPARAGFLRVDALTNGPVRLSSSLRICFHLPGAFLVGVPGLFLSRIIGLLTFGAHLLCQPIEQLCQDVSDGLHEYRFPFDFTAAGQANSETKGVGNVRKVVGEIRNV